ncbi:unnamed protein product [Tenebrio molitor]|nr:unnamed protein product [Tenebrio molitor]
MVNNAIKGLKERGGSSLQAIKKFVAANYKSTPKGRPFIKKYLKGAVASGSLVQTKGKGASGSFKLASSTSGGAKVASASDKRKPLRPPHPRRKNHPPNVPPSRRLPTRLPRRQPKQASPKRRRLLPKRRAPPLPPPPQRKPRNRPPPRLKRKLEPPRNPIAFQSEEI